MKRNRPALPPITFTDPEVRTATIDELAAISGIPVLTLRRMARQGLLKECGVIFSPSERNPEQGTYVCALKPFLNWFRGQATPVAQTTEASANAISMVHRIDLAKRALDGDDRLVG